MFGSVLHSGCAILTTTPWSSYSTYFHFTDERIVLQRWRNLLSYQKAEPEIELGTTGCQEELHGFFSVEHNTVAQPVTTNEVCPNPVWPPGRAQSQANTGHGGSVVGWKICYSHAVSEKRRNLAHLQNQILSARWGLSTTYYSRNSQLRATLLPKVTLKGPCLTKSEQIQVSQIPPSRDPATLSSPTRILPKWAKPQEIQKLASNSH